MIPKIVCPLVIRPFIYQSQLVLLSQPVLNLRLRIKGDVLLESYFRFTNLFLLTNLSVNEIWNKVKRIKLETSQNIRCDGINIMLHDEVVLLVVSVVEQNRRRTAPMDINFGGWAEIKSMS